MIAQRLRGLVNLHVAGATVLAALLLLAMGDLVRYQQRLLELSPDINMTPYLLCVIGGMLFSSRYLGQFAARYHRLTWVDAAQMTVRQVVCVALMIFAFMFAFKDRTMSRLFMGTYLCLCWGMLLFVNLGLPRMLSRLFFERGHKIATLFLGTRGSLEKLRNWMSAKEMLGLHAVGFLTLDGVAPDEGIGPPFLGGLADLPRRIEEVGALQVVVLEIPQSQEQGRFMIDTCQTAGCRMLIYSNLADLLHYPLICVTEEGHLFYTLQEEPLEDPINRIIKRTFDIGISLPVVALILPVLCPWIWIMQQIQSAGSLFFVQERTAYSGRRFRILKFRSMHDSERNDHTGTTQAKRGDARAYAFGQFLRRTSLDEIPQFLNVLLGDMSVVGPRPHLPAHDRLFAGMMHTYRTRFFVKPGITGLAQCNGLRGEITEPDKLQQRVQFDITYITNWSFWLDVQITFRTFKEVVQPPTSAY